MEISDEELSLPLYRLYEQVKMLDRQTGHATVDSQSYLLLLETLKKGYMIGSKKELFLLCEKIWLKPYHLGSDVLNRKKLRQLFNDSLGELAIMPDELEKSVDPFPKTKGKKNKVTRQPKSTIPAPPPKPAVVSELDKQMTAIQGEYTISVAAANHDDISTATQESEARNEFFSGKSFFVKGVYLPVNPRRIEQSIRSYRYRVKGHGIMEVDWDATLDLICQKGYFENFELREKVFFNTSWTVLIDQSPSMVAFTSYSEEIADSIAKGNSDEYDNIFYFRNLPGSHLHYDRFQSMPLSLKRFLEGPQRNILVISDAGAARGGFNEERIKASINFLDKLKKHRVAWMNPMPKARWTNTSAEMISAFTNMFDIGEGTHDNLGNIVRLFKSKINTGKL